ncbi:hypothetical protein QBC42DRAFT_274803 [Cladorrhinum samala]|uniref:Uncharacterized protein n=1 Tax=Cladorrhinum samala TaxID=585594 RepID=A0AAV9HIM9_9PEZI|nr:hypothetical protein QBC42DRAFT_274803 [Cladorrhinum samala]
MAAAIAGTISEYYSWFVGLTFLRILSLFFITLGSVFIVPIIFLVIYDVCLWLWRLSGIGGLIDRDPPPAAARSPNRPNRNENIDGNEKTTSPNGGAGQRKRRAG